jgi:hypothetical protein
MLDQHLSVLGFTKDTDPKEPWWVDKNGCSHEPDDLESLLINGVMGLCSCGCPDQSIELVANILKSFRDRSAAWDREPRRPLSWDSCMKPDSIRDAHDKRLLELCGNEACAEFVTHVLNECDLLEHGTGVRGSWITPKGEAFVAVAEAMQATDSAS